MPLESKFTEEQLFDNLISSLVHSIWISLGKVKNPMTDKIERNLFAASMNIDMIDMLYKRMDGNLLEQALFEHQLILPVVNQQGVILLKSFHCWDMKRTL